MAKIQPTDEVESYFKFWTARILWLLLAFLNACTNSERPDGATERIGKFLGSAYCSASAQLSESFWDPAATSSGEELGADARTVLTLLNATDNSGLILEHIENLMKREPHPQLHGMALSPIVLSNISETCPQLNPSEERAQLFIAGVLGFVRLGPAKLKQLASS